MIRNFKLTLPLLLYVVNLLLLHIKKTQINNQDVLYIHLFIFTIFFGFNKIKEMVKSDNHPITYYLSINIFRIIFSLLFLIPKIVELNKEEKHYIINFFVVYFSYLFTDIFRVIFYDKK